MLLCFGIFLFLVGGGILFSWSYCFMWMGLHVDGNQALKESLNNLFCHHLFLFKDECKHELESGILLQKRYTVNLMWQSCVCRVVFKSWNAILPMDEKICGVTCKTSFFAFLYSLLPVCPLYEIRPYFMRPHSHWKIRTLLLAGQELIPDSRGTFRLVSHGMPRHSWTAWYKHTYMTCSLTVDTLSMG